MGGHFWLLKRHVILEAFFFRAFCCCPFRFEVICSIFLLLKSPPTTTTITITFSLFYSATNSPFYLGFGKICNSTLGRKFGNFSHKKSFFFLDTFRKTFSSSFQTNDVTRASLSIFFSLGDGVVVQNSVELAKICWRRLEVLNFFLFWVKHL